MCVCVCIIWHARLYISGQSQNQWSSITTHFTGLNWQTGLKMNMRYGRHYWAILCSLNPGLNTLIYLNFNKVSYLHLYPFIKLNKVHSCVNISDKTSCYLNYVKNLIITCTKLIFWFLKQSRKHRLPEHMTLCWSDSLFNNAFLSILLWSSWPVSRLWEDLV